MSEITKTEHDCLSLVKEALESMLHNIIFSFMSVM